MEILTGHRERDGGHLSVLGVDPRVGGRAWRARLGIVLQTATDAAELTPGELVRHFARYYPNPMDPAEVLELAGLTAQAGQRVRSLSGGQRRRLDVALGILGTPELLFLDEPTTGFDPQARRQFWELVRSLAGRGTTILLTTHYLDEAEALADRVAVIARGRIVAVGTPTTLGGRDTSSATVSWTAPGGPRTEITANPTALVTALSAEFGGEVPDLTVTRPSLEDVYLDLIGAA